MADTRIQREIEGWVRTNWLEKEFNQPFSPKRLRLSSGGQFDFDAVSACGSIAANISTSAASTASGNAGAGKMQKLRSDMLFLLLARNVSRRLIILTDVTMYDACKKEMKSGRTPTEIEFLLADIPLELQNRLSVARKQAAREVTPEKISELPDSAILTSNKI